MKEIEAEARKFEQLCQAVQIPYAVFYQQNENELAGAANLTLKEMSIIFESFIRMIGTQELCFLLQLLTAHMQERSLQEKNPEENPETMTV